MSASTPTGSGRATAPRAGAPRLREGVEILRVGPDRFVLANPDTGERYQISSTEQRLLLLFDGRRRTQEIQRIHAQLFPNALSLRSLEEFVGQLGEHGLLVESPAAAPVTPLRPEPARRKPGTPNPPPPSQPPPEPPSVPEPLSSQDAGARLNRCFDLLVLLFGWVFHPLFALIVLALVIVAGVELARGFDRYTTELATLYRSVPAWILLPLSLIQTILCLNLPRELAVGMAARRFGGRVRSFGFVSLGGIVPLFHCDPGNITRLSRRGRVTVLLSGLVCLNLVGALAVIGWAMASPTSGIGVFCSLMVLPCAIALVLLLNPLVRLDGYKILCTLLQQGRLQERALAETNAWLGFRRSPEALTSRERFWLRVYGLGVHLWKWCLRAIYIVGGTWWLIAHLEGLGALIGLVLILLWYRRPLTSWLTGGSSLRWATRHGGRWQLRWAVRLALLAGVVAVGFLPYSHDIAGECLVAAGEEQGVRAQLRDEIVAVHVDHAEWVKAGSPIATLGGLEARAELEARQADLREAQADLALLRSGAHPEDVRIAEQEMEIWRLSLAFRETELDRAKALFAGSVASQSRVDRARQERDTAHEAWVSARENLAKVKKGPRPEEIEAAEARLANARARLSRAEQEMDLLVLRAPIDGRIVTPRIRGRIGQVVESGELVAVVQDTSALHLEMAADEAAAALVKPGMPVQARLRGLEGKPLNGWVRAASGAAFENRDFQVAATRTDREALADLAVDRSQGDSRYVRVDVQLAQEDAGLIPGMTGYARIAVGEDVLWRGLARPFLRYLRTEVWSWLP